jgi:hypothetical protein
MSDRTQKGSDIMSNQTQILHHSQESVGAGKANSLKACR